jgi:hypothetical protein
VCPVSTCRAAPDSQAPWYFRAVVREHLLDAARGALVLAVVATGCGSSSPAKDAATDHGMSGPGGAGGAGDRTDAGLVDGSAGRGGAAGAGQGGAAGAATVPDKVLADAAAPIGGTPLDTFDKDVDFGFEPYHDTAQKNLADPAVIDAGTAPLLTFDAEEGSPSPGSMKITVPYSGANQYVEVQSYVFVVPEDWSGHTLHARIKVDAGSTFHGYAQLYVDTGVSYIAASSTVSLASGADWQEIAMDVDHPMTVASDRYSAKQVVLYGLQLDTGASGAGAGPVTFHVDSFSLE